MYTWLCMFYSILNCTILKKITHDMHQILFDLLLCWIALSKAKQSIITDRAFTWPEATYLTQSILGAVDTLSAYYYSFVECCCYPIHSLNTSSLLSFDLTWCLVKVLLWIIFFVNKQWFVFVPWWISAYNFQGQY